MSKIDRLERSSHAAFLRGVILLTETQARTLARVFCGKQPAEIANELGLTLPTIKMHLNLALKKLNSPDVGQATVDLLRLSHSFDELTQEERKALAALIAAFPEIPRGFHKTMAVPLENVSHPAPVKKPEQPRTKDASAAPLKAGVAKQIAFPNHVQRPKRRSIWRRYAKS